MISTPNSLGLIYHFPNPFPKIAWFTGESLKHLQVIGSELYGPIYTGVFSDICPLFSTPNFLAMITPAQIAWCF
jgi:hypothetical protein